MSETTENRMSEEQKLTPEENLRNINLILEELAHLDPSGKTDEELIDFVENRKLPKYIPFPFIKIKFGKVFETINNHISLKKIKVYYQNNQGSKSLVDFIYKIKMGSWLKDRSKILSTDFDVHRKYGGFWRIFLSSEYDVIQLLEDKNFILYSSRPGYNDYNQKVNIWSLIPLKEEDSINSKIIREGLIRGYYNALCDFYYSVST